MTNPETNPPAVSIIIVNWNTRDYLEQCLRSIAPEGIQINCEILVVDNASSDGSVEMCRQQFPHVRVIENSENVGFGMANNQAVELSEAEYCWLLNSDTVVEAGCIEALYATMQSDRSIGVLGCRLLNSDRTVQFSCLRFPSLHLTILQETMLYKLLPNRLHLFVEPPLVSSRIDCDWIYGAAMLFRKAAFQHVRGFDPRILMYGEEMELCYRLRQAGWRIVFEPNVRVIHYGEGSWRGDAARPMLLRQRGLIFFYRKHHSTIAAFLVWLIVILGTSLRCLVWAAWAGLHLFGRAGRRNASQRCKVNVAVLVQLLRPYWLAPGL